MSESKYGKGFPAWRAVKLISICSLIKPPLLCAALLAITLGCSESSRLSIDGTVTMDDMPLEEGSLTLIPLSGGPSCGALITNGSFSIGRQRGAITGKYRVQIESWEASGKVVQELDNEGLVMDRIQVIPTRYNLDSELTIDVAPGKTHFTFELKSASPNTAEE